MRIPMEGTPGYTAEDLEVAQGSSLYQKLKSFIRSNYKNFTLGDMAHVLGVSPKVLRECAPYVKPDKVQHKTQMVVVLVHPSMAAQESADWKEGKI